MNAITASNNLSVIKLTMKAQTVYYALANRSNNKTHICYPGIKKIAEDTNISISSVRRAIKELMSHGLITKRYNYRPNGSQTSNVYILCDDLSKRNEVIDENIRLTQKYLDRYNHQIERNREMKKRDETYAAASANTKLKIQAYILSLKINCMKMQKEYNTIKGHVCAKVSKFLKGGCQNDIPNNPDIFTYRKRKNIARE